MNTVSSLYIHVPFCKHLCNYCDFYKQRLDKKLNQIVEYNEFLVNSLNAHQNLMDEYDIKWNNLESVYLGGGTPSLWGLEGAKFFKDEILKTISLSPSCEFTMEVDPGTWNEELISTWKAIGLNRISIGTQSLDQNFLKILDRSHSLEESHELLSFCKNNHWNFSLDFLLGVPYSKKYKRNIIDELHELLNYSPTHISLYILNARSKYPLISEIPDDEFIREEYLAVSRFLTSKGFNHYEVSNFAKPGYESIHNMKYWKSSSVAALGPTGTGLFDLGQNKAIRYKWKVSTPIYEKELLTEHELNLEKIYLSLRTNLGWKPSFVSHDLLEVLNKWGSLNYGSWDGEKIILNSLGFVMLDSLMDDLFRIGAA